MVDRSSNVWRILLVDDDEDDYLITRDMLDQAKGQKIRLEWAPTYQAGQQLLQANHFHAVLVDYDLGLHNGITLIRETIARGYEAPLILYTGRGSFEVDVEAMEAGATLYLTKRDANPLMLERLIRYAIERKQAEADLRRARDEAQANADWLQLAQQAGGIGLFDWDMVANTSIWTEQLDILYGFPPGQTGSAMWPDMVHLDDKEEANERIRKAIQEQRSTITSEYRIIRLDGQVRWLSSRATITYDSSGSPVRMTGATVDITDRKRAEEALCISEERYRVAVINGPGVYAQTDRELRYQWIHHPHPDFQVSDVLGKRDDELEDSEDIHHLVALKQRVLDSGVGLREEVSFHRSDGIHTYDMTIEPLLDSAGKITGVTTASLDITERKRAEDALQAAHRQTVEILESINDAFYSLDQQSRFTYVNEKAARLWKKRPEELLGKNIWEAFPAGKQTESFQKIQQALADGQPAQYQSYSTFLNEWVDVHLYPTDQGISVYFRDITEQKQLEALQQEQTLQMEIQRRLSEYREKERQAIARELHDGPVQSLSSLIFRVQFSKEMHLDPAIQLEHEAILLSLQETVQDLRRMMNELRPPSLIRFGLAKTIRVYLDDFSVKHPQIAFELSLENDIDCLSEQVRLELFRILQEALNNTVKHAQATQVSIHFSCDNQQAVLEYQDNGAGFNLSSNLIDYIENSHYGLAGMKERAESIGGEFQVFSAPGQGTEIKVRI